MNAMQEIAEARATALTLRASARACSSEQGSLRFRLMRAAKSLDGMVLLAVRALDRIQELEQQLAGRIARSGSIERADVSRFAARPPGAAIAPVMVGGVDVAPLATAVNLVSLVESASSDEWATEVEVLRASLRMARTLVQETFEDLQAASARGAS